MRIVTVVCANPSPTPLGKIAAEPLQPHLDLVRREPVKNRRKLSRPAFRVLDPRGPDLRAETPAGSPPAVCALTVRACARGSAEGKARYFPYSCCDRRSRVNMRVNRLPDCRNRNLRARLSGLRCPGPIRVLVFDKNETKSLKRNRVLP
jgi:hypothetical protein